MLLSTLALAFCLAAQDSDSILRLDDGVMTGRDVGGAARSIRFELGDEPRTLRAVEVFGTRAAAGYDPRSARLLIEVLGQDGDVLHATRAPYERFRPGRLIRTNDFEAGRFGWVELLLDSDVEVAGAFELRLTPDTLAPGALAMGTGDHDATWMVRAVLRTGARDDVRVTTDAALPAPGQEIYLADFESMVATITEHYPGFEKKGLDWEELIEEYAAHFSSAETHEQHFANAYHFIAELKDAHSSVTTTAVPFRIPSINDLHGLEGAGMWIASERGKLVLRALAAGHPLAGELPRGSELLSVGGVPALEVQRAVRARLERWQGWSSDQFIDARLSATFFPFDGRPALDARFLLPDGKVASVELASLQRISRVAHTGPAGLDQGGLATSLMIDESIGYVRVLGAMGPPTEAAFHRAFEKLRAARAIVVDCRGMGGGSTSVAWSIAGRFFRERVSMEGAFQHMEPTGEWQFDGPVVMLQDGTEASAAEGFAMAMTEPERVIAVGGPTGGVTMMPREFSVPSKLFKYRVSYFDFETWETGYSPEGIGILPDVRVPNTASLLARVRDPELEVGVSILRARLAGLGRAEAIEYFGGLLDPDASRLNTAVPTNNDALTEFLSHDHVKDWLAEEQHSAAHESTPVDSTPRIHALKSLLQKVTAND